MRLVYIPLTVLVVLLISACSGQASESSTVTVTPTPELSRAQIGESTQEASQDFLTAVCPTDSALQDLNQAALAAGGWAKVPPRDIHGLSDLALEAVRNTSAVLESSSWPPEVASDMPAVAEEYLAMLRPLTTLSESNSGEQLRRAWQFLNTFSRTREQAVRIALGLGPVDSAGDGCPPPAPISAPPQPAPTAPAGASGAWTQLWQSPSGNIRCGFTPKGSAGVPTVACLVADENRLARLPQGSEAIYFPTATESQRSQLPGGPTLGYGAYVTAGPFECWQSPPDGVGMTCTEVATGRGFAIKRGSFLRF